jgi:outer membrane protein assembly factor BamB
MKLASLFKLGGVLLASLISLSFLVQPEGTGWRGPHRNGVVTGFEIPESWPVQLKPDWQVVVGLGDASPVLSDEKLYLHTRKNDSEVAMCLDAHTGKIIWEEINNPAPEVTGGAASHPGPRSTPSVAYGKVFNAGAGGHITCRDAATGRLIWDSAGFIQEVPQFFVACSPLIIDNKCIFHLNGKEKGTVVAFDVNTGEVIWRHEGEPSTYSSPLHMPAFGDMVVVQGETDLFALSASTGNLLWKYPTPAETRFYNSSTPVVYNDLIYIAGQGSGTRALRVENGPEGYRVSEQWHNPSIGVSFNTPVLKDGFLYGNEARFGNVFCINALNGELCWADTTKHIRFASVQDVGPAMVTLPSNGILLIYEPDQKNYRQLMAYKVSDTDVYAHPVLHNSRVWVKDKEYLTCWSFK